MTGTSLLSSLVTLPDLPPIPNNVSRQTAWYLAAAAATLVTWQALASRKNRGGEGKELPKPPTLPVLGNIHHIRGSPINCFETWAAKLGPIYQFYMGSERWIIVNDLDVAHDLASKRGTNYNSRASGELRYATSHGYKDIALSRYGDDWRRRRRYFMDATVRKLDAYQANIDKEAEHLINGLRTTNSRPVNPTDYLLLYTYNVIMRMLFDERCDDPFDPWFQEEMRLQYENFQISSPSSNPAKFFPFLRILPQKWIGYRVKDVLAWRFKVDSRLEIMFERLRKRSAEGEAVHCFCADLLEMEKLGDIDHEELLCLCSSTIGAGVETTANTLNWWIASMANHPGVQARAYEEIRMLYNDNTCPKYEDAQKLVYLDSTIRETLRLYPVAPLGVPHIVSEDDVYRGFHIPGDTTIIFNCWNMNRDARKYPNPTVYDPDRFHNIHTPSSTLMHGKTEDRDHTSFGFGRRVCPGTHLAEHELITAAAALLWAFEIVREGDALIDTERYHLGLTMSPLSYKVKFVPRNHRI